MQLRMMIWFSCDTKWSILPADLAGCKMAIYGGLIMLINVKDYKPLTIRRRRDYIIGFIAPAINPNKSKKLAPLIAPTYNIRGKV